MSRRPTIDEIARLDPESWPVALTVQEAAAILAVSTRTISRMLRAGELRAIRIGGTRRIPRSSLAALLEGERGTR